MIKFSIIIPVFNKEDYVLQTVNSVLGQEYKNFELLVIDDGSTDNSLQKLEHISDSRLRIISQDNSGVSAARNKGLSISNNEYICFLDADDLWSPSHLSIIANQINRYPDCIAWTTGYTVLSGFDTVDMQNSSQATNRSELLDAEDFYKYWEISPFFWTGSICVNVYNLKSFRYLFPVGESLGEDQDLWFRISEGGRICHTYINDTAFYRIGTKNSLSSSSRVLRPLPCFERLLERTKGFQRKSQKDSAIKVYRTHLLHVAWANLLSNQRMLAFYYLVKARGTHRLLYSLRISIFLFIPSSIFKKFNKLKIYLTQFNYKSAYFR